MRVVKFYVRWSHTIIIIILTWKTAGSYNKIFFTSNANISNPDIINGCKIKKHNPLHVPRITNMIAKAFWPYFQNLYTCSKMILWHLFGPVLYVRTLVCPSVKWNSASNTLIGMPVFQISRSTFFLCCCCPFIAVLMPYLFFQMSNYLFGS